MDLKAHPSKSTCPSCDVRFICQYRVMEMTLTKLTDAKQVWTIPVTDSDVTKGVIYRIQISSVDLQQDGGGWTQDVVL